MSAPADPRDVELQVPTTESMRELGAALAKLLRAGDLVLLSGPLGAGKTTLAQGVGRGLHVRGQVASPTFVISRIHPSLVGGPALVHVDAYRLGGVAELDDIDLDTDLASSVTLVEWGGGLAAALSDDRLEIVIDRDAGLADDDDRRLVTIRPVGARWSAADLAALAGAASRPGDPVR